MLAYVPCLAAICQRQLKSWLIDWFWHAAAGAVLHAMIIGEERRCLVSFARLANTLLEQEVSARNNHVLACNFAN